MAEPPISLRAIHDSGPFQQPVTRIVIHATCPDVGYPRASEPGSAHGTALYFQQAASGGSAHYIEAVDGEEHCVPDDIRAWHAPPCNDDAIGIEICAEGGSYPASYSREQWLSDAVWPGVLRAANRARELCDRFGVPKTRIGTADLLAGAHGICGHVDVSQAWHQSDHSDPGPEFPWAEFMAEVNQEDSFMAALSDDQQRQMYFALMENAGQTGRNNFAWLNDQIQGRLDKIEQRLMKDPGGSADRLRDVWGELEAIKALVTPKPTKP